MDELEQALRDTYGKKEETTEQKTEESTEQRTETTQEETKTETTEQKTEVFDPSDFNTRYGKKFGIEVKEENELGEILSTPAKYKEALDAHEITKREYETLKAEYESKKENLQFFDLTQHVDKDLLKASEMRKKYPDKDTSIMTDICTMNLDNVADEKAKIDLLVKQARLNEPSIFKTKNDSSIKTYLAEKFNGADLDDPSTWDEVTQIKVDKDYNQARNEFKAYQSVELPVPIDVEKLREEYFSKEKGMVEQSKQQWTPLVDKMIADFKELVIPDDEFGEFKFNPELSESFKEEVKSYLDFLAYTKQPINEQTLTNVAETIRGRYVAKDFHKIMKAHALSVKTKVDDAWHNKVHTDTPSSTKIKEKQQGTDGLDRLEQALSNM